MSSCLFWAWSRWFWLSWVASAVGLTVRGAEIVLLVCARSFKDFLSMRLGEIFEPRLSPLFLLARSVSTHRQSTESVMTDRILTDFRLAAWIWLGFTFGPWTIIELHRRVGLWLQNISAVAAARVLLADEDTLRDLREVAHDSTKATSHSGDVDLWACGVFPTACCLASDESRSERNHEC